MSVDETRIFQKNGRVCFSLHPRFIRGFYTKTILSIRVHPGLIRRRREAFEISVASEVKPTRLARNFPKISL